MMFTKSKKIPTKLNSPLDIVLTASQSAQGADYCGIQAIISDQFESLETWQA